MYYPNDNEMSHGRLLVPTYRRLLHVHLHERFRKVSVYLTEIIYEI